MPTKKTASKKAAEKPPVTGRMVAVKVGSQPIFEGKHRAPGSECKLPAARVKALGSLVERIKD